MSKKRQRGESVATESPNVAGERLEQLRQLFPDAVSEGKLDLEKLRAAVGDIADDRPERYSFTWAGKRDAIRLLQTPSRATLVPCPDESVNFDSTKHLFIEGDNLEVLKLLYKSYAGRVKMIYIDPPYNTGGDFVYPDNFSDPLDTYLKMTGQKSDSGDLLTSNPESSGRYHSAWLTMMYPRLFLARQLLNEDGSVWISIDDNEFNNLRSICNEIFGEENFVATFIWQKRTTRENRKVFSFNHDYIVCYARDRIKFQSSRGLLPLGEEVRERYSNPDNDPRGEWQSVSLNAQAGPGRRKEQFYSVRTPGGRTVNPPSGRCWTVVKKRMDELIKDNRVWFGADGNNVPREKIFLSEARDGLTPHTLWTAEEVGTTDSAKKALIKVFDGLEAYDTPKPLELLERIIGIASGGDFHDLVLDFFAGSATTGHAVLSLNRKDGSNRRFIMAQIQEPVPHDSVAWNARLRTITAIGEERLRRAIKQLKKEGNGKLDLKDRDEPEDLGFRVFKLAESHFRRWSGTEDKDPKEWAKQMELFVDPLLPGWDAINVIQEVALKEGYSLTSRIEKLHPKEVKTNTVYRVTDDDRGQSFLICLDEKLKAPTPKALGLKKDDVFICRDVALTDELAANLALQCRLKTI